MIDQFRRSANYVDRILKGVGRLAGNVALCATAPYWRRYGSSLETLAARHKLPAVYYLRYFVIDGGLIARPAFLRDRVPAPTSRSEVNHQLIFCWLLDRDGPVMGRLGG